MGQTINGATGIAAKPIGDALANAGTGIANGGKDVAKGVEVAAKWRLSGTEKRY